jgi:hypothetical protein
VVRVTATPAKPSDGPKLADEILSTIAAVARSGGEPNGSAAEALDKGPRARNERDGVVSPTKAQGGPHV